MVNGQKRTVRDNICCYTLGRSLCLVCVHWHVRLRCYVWHMKWCVRTGQRPFRVATVRSPPQPTNVIWCNQCRVNYSSFFYGLLLLLFLCHILSRRFLQLAQQLFQVPMKFRGFFFFLRKTFIRNAYHQLDRNKVAYIIFASKVLNYIFPPRFLHSSADTELFYGCAAYHSFCFCIKFVVFRWR